MLQLLRPCLCCLLLGMTIVKSQNTHQFNETIRHFITAVQNAFCERMSNDSEHKLVNASSASAVNSMFVRLSTRPPVRPAWDCCDTCSSRPDCIRTDTCCPEMTETVPRVSTHTICQRLQLRPASKLYANSEHSFLMLKGCSIGNVKMEINHPFRKKCESPEEYNALDTKVPVTDLDTDALYINQYCAFCNGALEEKLVHWEPTVLCINSSIRAPSMDTIVSDVAKSNDCNMIYNEPAAVSGRAQTCTTYISSCNVTGWWSRYDPFVEEACRAYSSRYDGKYRNVFCYICNTNDLLGQDTCSDFQPTIDRTHITVTVSFSLVIQFKPRGTSNPFSGTMASQCTTEQMYDFYMDVCRNIVCYPPMEYINGTCVYPFDHITGRGYRFYLKLTPAKTRKADKPISVMRDTNQFTSILWTNLSLPLECQTTRTFVKYLDTKDSHNPSSSLSKCTDNQDIHANSETLEYYLIQIDICIPGDFRVNTSIIDRILQLDDTMVRLKADRNNTNEFHTAFIVANLTMVEGMANAMRDVVSDSVLCEQSPDHSINNTMNDQEQLSNNTFINTDSSANCTGEIYCGDAGFEIVTSTNRCPLILLPEEEFQTTLYKWGIHVKQLNINISRPEYLQFPNEHGKMSLYICKDFYISIIVSMLSLDHRTRTSPQGVLSMICTLLSIFCSVLTLITYALFKELRTQPGLNNIMLTSSLICAQILFQFGTGQAKNVSVWFCETLGVLVHFSWLLTMMWMNVCSLHMFRVFRSLKQKLATDSITKTTLLYTLYCFVSALTPVIINIIYSHSKDNNIGYGGKLCYISNPLQVKFTFALPVGMIVLANMFLFLAVIIKLREISKMKVKSSKNRNFPKIYIKISTVTGLTWTFGFLFAFTNLEFLEYIFIILNCGLGVLIFFSFVCNKRVLKLYLRILGSKATRSNYSESTRMSSISTLSNQRVYQNERTEL